MKNSRDAMLRKSDGFFYLKEIFPRFIDAKIKAEIFIVPQRRELIKD
jgi:hypothetical protein